jgi:hypothetical protein
MAQINSASVNAPGATTRRISEVSSADMAQNEWNGVDIRDPWRKFIDDEWFTKLGDRGQELVRAKRRHNLGRGHGGHGYGGRGHGGRGRGHGGRAAVKAGIIMEAMEAKAKIMSGVLMRPQQVNMPRHLRKVQEGASLQR